MVWENSIQVAPFSYKLTYLALLILFSIMITLYSCSPSSNPEIACVKFVEGSTEYDITIMRTTNLNSVFYQGDTVYIDNMPIRIDGITVFEGHTYYNVHTLDSLLIDTYGETSAYFSSAGSFVYLSKGLYFIGEASGKDDYLLVESDLRDSLCEIDIPLVTSLDTVLLLKCPLGDVGVRWLYREVVGEWTIYKEYMGDTIITVVSDNADHNAWIIECQFDMDNDGNNDDFIDCREYFSKDGLIRREIRRYRARTVESSGGTAFVEDYYTRIMQRQ